MNKDNTEFQEQVDLTALLKEEKAFEDSIDPETIKILIRHLKTSKDIPIQGLPLAVPEDEAFRAQLKADLDLLIDNKTADGEAGFKVRLRLPFIVFHQIIMSVPEWIDQIIKKINKGNPE